MPHELWKITGGRIYDPLHGLDGQLGDIWISGDKIVAAPTDPRQRPQRELHVEGMVVMPGGVDLHCHMAGGKANLARRMCPEQKRQDAPVLRTAERRSGTMGSVPSTFATGYRYAGLGYTTAFDAAVAPLGARHAHEELADTPCLDKGFLLLMGNHHFALQSIGRHDSQHLSSFVAWLLSAAKAYGVKLVNPGGVESWKQRSTGTATGLDDRIDHFNVTPRQIIREVSRTVDELGLPHSTHIHCNRLGLPGNWTTTLETMRALEGHRGHLTHIQFHSYAGGDGDESTFGSQVAPLADYVNQHPEITVDVGQVMFGETTSMTGDSPVGHYLANLYGRKWFSGDLEMESGCGIVPIRYRQRSLIHAWQWAIGLEWYLLVQDPWRIAMSTDHPNGGSFLAYPRIIRLLMDRDYREELLRSVHPAVVAGSQLRDLRREYTLREIAIITRAAPARILGLHHKGHLGPGADADITIYTPHANQEIMFQLPRYVIKSGKVLVEEGELRNILLGKTLHVAPPRDPGAETVIRKWFDDHYSVSWNNYPVSGESISHPETVACRDLHP